MSSTFHSYRVADGHGLSHDPMSGIIGPRPIGWISSLSLEGTRNLAPYSFFNMFNYHPPLLGFSSVGWKDTVANVVATREFVWNLATRDLAEAMNETSATLAPEADEFEASGLNAEPSLLVAPPRVAESPVALECRVTSVQRLLDVEGSETEATLIVGQVLAVHIEAGLIRSGRYDTAAARPVLRGGGNSDYFEVTEGALFHMRRPRR